MAQATLKQVADFFRTEGDTLKKFSDEWKLLPEQDREDLKSGIGNGTLTY